jgi:uncharacterized protein
MKVIVDIGHPAHVHLFRNFATEMEKKGHKVLFTARDKEFEIRLLSHYGFQFISFGKHRKSKIGKLWGLFIFTLKLWMVSFRFKPDVYFSHGSVYAALAARLYGKPHISMEDTGNWEQVKIYKPFTRAILTSLSFPINYGEKQVNYDGYHETAYMHPNYFKPDDSVYQLLKIEKNQPYSILRFVSWKATHDVGQQGLSPDDKIRLVKELTKYGAVYITAEEELPAELEKYKIKIPPEKMHDALSFAQLFVGEGVTMASECAHIGTPAIYVNSLQRGYTTEEEKKYKLVFNFISGEGVIDKALEILDTPDLKATFQARSDKLLNDKIDVTAFMTWFIEQWPASFKTMKENPEYYRKFK